VSEASLALQRGIFKTLTTNSEVIELIGNRVYDRVSTGTLPTFPYVRIGNDQTINEDHDCIPECVEVFSQVDVFSREQGKTQAKAIAGAVVRALKTNNVQIEPAYALLSIVHEETRYLDDPDGLSTHAVLSFHALIDGVQ
jgi:Protein of unknown function (DUF3168)